MDDSTLQQAEDKLAETPCHAARTFEQVVFPEKKAPEVLRMKWAGEQAPHPTPGGGAIMTPRGAGEHQSVSPTSMDVHSNIRRNSNHAMEAS